MHDEECAIGLNVSNNDGIVWRAYGDKRLFSPENPGNLELCRSALRGSAAEIYDAWHAGHNPTLFVALILAPRGVYDLFQSSAGPATSLCASPRRNSRTAALERRRSSGYQNHIGLLVRHHFCLVQDQREMELSTAQNGSLIFGADNSSAFLLSLVPIMPAQPRRYRSNCVCRSGSTRFCYRVSR